MGSAGDILLIEPDKVMAATYKTALDGQGFSVRHAFDAQSAVIAADERCPDLVICEVQLIGHSGIEFLYEFRSYIDWQNVPVLILTSVPPIEFSAARKGLGQELGVECYLYKPNTTITQLLREIDTLLLKTDESA